MKSRILDLVDNEQIMPLWIIDEAQNLPLDFFRDLPAFLNYAFDSRDLITVWLVGHPSLIHTMERAPYAALYSHLQVRPLIKLAMISTEEGAATTLHCATSPQAGSKTGL